MRSKTKNVKESVTFPSDLPPSLQAAFSKSGITRIDLSLKSGYSVFDCLVSANQSLAFLGIAGLKWTSQNEEYEKMRKRISLFSQDSQLRFLLLDPTCKDAEFFCAARNVEISRHQEDLERTLDFFRLSNQTGGVQARVRFYSSLPNFRISIVDNAAVIVGSYSLSDESGLDTPQMTFTTGSHWSFARNFIAYFELLWKNSNDGY